MGKPSRRRQLVSFGLTLLAALTFRSVVASAYVIPSGSMIPTLQVGDRVLVEKVSLGLSVPLTNWKIAAALPTPGDVVVFVHPRTGEDLIKRVVAVAGQTVAMRGGRLFVDGELLERQPLGPAHHDDFDEATGRWYPQSYLAWKERIGTAVYTTLSMGEPAHGDFGPLTVPPGQMFVLGDNRDNSNDSRYWGFVPVENVVGRAVGVFWSSGPDGARWERFFQPL